MKSPRHLLRQRGVAAVEFALIASIFFMLLIGIMEMGRILFYWNTATEATRLGARLAVVCDIGDNAIKSRMVALFPLLSSANISIDYLPGNCTAASCEQVTVRIVAAGTVIPTYLPFVPLSLTLPGFATTLSRESMQSSSDGVSNPVCSSAPSF